MSILFIAFFILINNSIKAFPFFTTDSILEIQLKLIQKSEGTTIKHTGLSISIVNHSNEDIYIPGFYIKTVTCVSIYEKKDSQFIKIDLFGKGNNSKWEFSADNSVTISESFSYTGNEITEILNKKIGKIYESQDSIVQLLISSDSTHKNDWVDPFIKPIFIKAHQRLEDFHVFNIDHLFKEKMEYRISFELSDYDDDDFPTKALEYKKYNPKFLKSNTIYYSML